jgi:hypothetical protein
VDVQSESSNATEITTDAHERLVGEICGLILKSESIIVPDDLDIDLEFHVNVCLERINNIVVEEERRSGCQQQVVTASIYPPTTCAGPPKRGHEDFIPSGSTNGKGKRKCSGNGDDAQGHERNDGPDDGSNGDADDGYNTGDGGRNKKTKTGDTAHNFACPFRKRNRIRFNVRTHTSCATISFASITLLK